jgi:excisionase family DNA binding protein
MHELYTVENVAERLGVHTRTVLRAIRNRRLKATRIGKAFRILKSDFEAFSGIAADGDESSSRATCVVDVPGLSPDMAQRISNTLTASVVGRERRPDPIELTTAYDPGRRTMKVVVIARPSDVAALLHHLQVLQETA